MRRLTRPSSPAPRAGIAVLGVALVGLAVPASASAQAPAPPQAPPGAGGPHVAAPAPAPAPAPPPTPAPPAAVPAPTLEPVPSHRRTVGGTRARLRTDGKAAIPRGAPRRVRMLIAAANRIVGKPYRWGGGHARLFDRGYDCSGTVSFALIRSGMLDAPQASGGLARWGERGEGRWLTVYANAGHVYLEVPGLRLDTSRVGDPRGGSGPRWRPTIGRRPGFHARRVAR